FKEQRELDGLPDRIAALEAEQSEINAALADGSLYSIDNVRALKLATRNSAIDDELMAALERWEVLGRPV
ncbi:MAG: ABC transporter ATP-binding protein, partial [Rhodoferax sp.]|nr:ABC transporter ATP-binding protein [Rhodoferax sp.]